MIPAEPIPPIIDFNNAVSIIPEENIFIGTSDTDNYIGSENAEAMVGVNTINDFSNEDTLAIVGFNFEEIEFLPKVDANVTDILLTALFKLMNHIAITKTL
ncbi:MAG: hypothetical protein AB4080_24510 [Trichodesmium sp.]